MNHMSTNTRRSFIQIAIAATAAFFGFKPKAISGFESWRFPRADKQARTADFHLRIQRAATDGKFQAVLTTRNAEGQYEHVAVECNGLSTTPKLNRKIVIDDAMRRSALKCEEMFGPDPAEANYDNAEGSLIRHPRVEPLPKLELLANTFPCLDTLNKVRRGARIGICRDAAAMNYNLYGVFLEPNGNLVIAHYYDDTGNEIKTAVFNPA